MSCILCNSEENIIPFECGHNLCNHDLQKKILDKYPEFIDGNILSKHVIFNDDRYDHEYCKMWFSKSDEMSGCIECDVCKTQYSIMSNDYKQFGIPSKIHSLVHFQQDDYDYVFYVCSEIDFIHLTDKKSQKQLLLEYDTNPDCFDSNDMDKYPSLRLMALSKERHNYAVMLDGEFMILPQSTYNLMMNDVCIKDLISKNTLEKIEFNICTIIQFFQQLL